MNLLKNRNNVITYTVNKNVNDNLYISVQNGEVIISAPWYTTSMQIQKIVEEKKQWIINKLNEYEKNCQEKKEKEYIKLDTVKLLGKDYDLAVKYKMIANPNLSVEEDKILVELPLKFKKIRNTELIEMLIRKMYDMVSKKEIERLMEKTRIMMQMAPEDYEIKRMDGSIAKCINKKITINPDIAKYDRKIIEYVIIHEFCHLRYKNHTKSFYDMVATYLPNYEQYAKDISKFRY